MRQQCLWRLGGDWNSACWQLDRCLGGSRGVNSTGSTGSYSSERVVANLCKPDKEEYQGKL